MCIHIMGITQPPGIGMPPLMLRAPFHVMAADSTNTAAARSRNHSSLRDSFGPAGRDRLIGAFAAVPIVGELPVFSAVVVLEIGVEPHHARRPQREPLGR